MNITESLKCAHFWFDCPLWTDYWKHPPRRAASYWQRRILFRTGPLSPFRRSLGSLGYRAKGSWSHNWFKDTYLSQWWSCCEVSRCPSAVCAAPVEFRVGVAPIPCWRRLSDLKLAIISLPRFRTESAGDRYGTKNDFCRTLATR